MKFLINVALAAALCAVASKSIDPCSKYSTDNDNFW